MFIYLRYLNAFFFTPNCHLSVTGVITDSPAATSTADIDTTIQTSTATTILYPAQGSERPRKPRGVLPRNRACVKAGLTHPDVRVLLCLNLNVSHCGLSEGGRRSWTTEGEGVLASASSTTWLQGNKRLDGNERRSMDERVWTIGQ